MEVLYRAVIACSLLLVAHAQEINVSAEVWVAVGLIGGIVAVVVGLIWLVFCIMLYKHHKEHEYDNEEGEDKVSETRNGNQEQKRKHKNIANQKQKKREEQTETTVHHTGSLPPQDIQDSEDLWTAVERPTVYDIIHQDENLPLSTQSPAPVPETPIPDDEQTESAIEENTDESFKPRAVLLPSTTTDQPVATATNNESFKLRAVLSPSSTSSSVPNTLESLFTPPTESHEYEDNIDVVGKRLHAKLSNVSASSRLRKISDVEECEVQPELSNFPLRYGQRRHSNTGNALSNFGSVDPFSFNLEPPRFGRRLDKKDISVTKNEHNMNSTDYRDKIFGQLSSWPEFY